jgi:leukotriene-A4 hydrolase
MCLQFALSEQKVEAFGSPLSITLPSVVSDSLKVRIFYETSPEASAIQWLGAEQTKGKKHPYLFTQCQAIHARSLYPCQDAPGAKFTYTAEIQVDAPLVVVMSAIQEKEIGKSADDKKLVYKFVQKVPISSYLLAIAIGNLTCKRFGVNDRCSVWSEPEMVSFFIQLCNLRFVLQIDECFAEFGADTDNFVATAEKICGPYVWGEYGLLVLPPSFPYGGMENPCMTFATPTLLAGDRSLVDVVAHEISHSWFGNLVTNRTWEDFWLNEGFTVYLERRITANYYGEKGEKLRHLQAEIGWRHLIDSVALYGADHEYTKLIPKLDGVDPDDAFSSVPYEKGFAFLFYLEQLVGGPQKMEGYLRAHCDKFQFATVSSSEFKAFFLDYFKDQAENLSKVDWNWWYTAPGLPAEPALDTTLSDACTTLAHDWFYGQPGNQFAEFSPLQVQIFLEKVLVEVENKVKSDGEAGVREILGRMDEQYHFSESKSAEVKFRWFTANLKAKETKIFDKVLEFATSQGRMKFTRPLFRELAKVSPEAKALAQETFIKNRGFYHSICAKMVAKDLEIAK